MSSAGGSANGADELVVRFDQHQLLLLDRLKDEEGFGDTYEDVILEAFRAYVEGTDPSDGGAE